MMVPTVHLNGTSKSELRDQLSGVTQALDSTLQALMRAAPNGRDYYPQGPDALDAALAEHKGRVQMLRALMNEVVEIATKVEEQDAQVGCRDEPQAT